MSETQNVEPVKREASNTQQWEARQHLPRRIRPRLFSIVFGFLVTFLVMGICLFGLDVWLGLGAWRGWAMVESVGTVLAVFSAIGIAWLEVSSSRRQQERQTDFTRLLLTREIRANVDELQSAENYVFEKYAQLEALRSNESDKRWRTISFDAVPQPPPIFIRASIKDRLEAQLAISSQSFTVWEIDQVDAFYYSLGQFQSKIDETREAIDASLLKTVEELYSCFSRLVRDIDKLALQSKAIELVKHLEMSPQDSQRRERRA